MIPQPGDYPRVPPPPYYHVGDVVEGSRERHAPGPPRAAAHIEWRALSPKARLPPAQPQSISVCSAAQALRTTSAYQAVSRVQSQIKRWLDGTLQGAAEPEHLQQYLNEFEFRFNRRTANRPGLPFYRLLEQAVRTEPAGYRDIAVGGTRPRDTPPRPPAGTRGLPETLAQPDAGRPWRAISRQNTVVRWRGHSTQCRGHEVLAGQRLRRTKTLPPGEEGTSY